MTHRKGEPIKGGGIAIDGHGHTMPYTDIEIDAIVRAALHTGTLRMVMVESVDGHLMVRVSGLPCQDNLDALEQATAAYRKLLKGH